MTTFDELTIVTSCVNYGKYLSDWANSIARQTVKPGHVRIFTHGACTDNEYGKTAYRILQHVPGIRSVVHVHESHTLDLAVARNRAVALSETEWVVHFDADDILNVDAVAEFKRVSPDADVVQAGYERVGQVQGLSTHKRLYSGADGLAALDLSALASGNSMFRRRFWEQSPYRTDMLGAWDTALWVGFARLGARFRPSKTSIFKYRQHMDSVFNKRRLQMGWARVHTTAMMKSLRRNYHGVAIIVPRDMRPTTERARNWARVRRHYETHHPDWQIIEGFCSSVTWIKGAAIQDALNRCTAEVLIIADADVLVDPSALEASVAQVQHGDFAWAMPHRLVHRANEATTENLCRTTILYTPRATSLQRQPYEGAPGGGIVVVKHVMYNAIGGIPQSFRGWGSEDRALALLCDTLIGPCQRGVADLVHLWHAPQDIAHQAPANLQLLRNMGHAALKGRDQLVQTVQSMPRPAVGACYSKVIPLRGVR